MHRNLSKLALKKMSNLTVNLSLPRELVALKLVRQGRISIGKGAKLLGIAKVDFIQSTSKNTNLIESRHEIPVVSDPSDSQ